jgi:imidazolonepropionase-like amidohydrolase
MGVEAFLSKTPLLLFEERRLLRLPAAEITIPADALRVDARGMSVLPGLIDSHFHSRLNLITPVTYELHRGITSFRDPGHPFHFYDPVLRTALMMPRVFLCGAHLDGPPPVWPDQAIVIRDASHARQTVNEHVDGGASAIKVYFRLPLEHISAVCEEAKERNVLVTAHLELVDADQAIHAGVRGIEHVTSFGTTLASPENVARFKQAVTLDSGARREMRHWLWSTLDLERSVRSKRLIELLIEKEVYVSPTLAIFERRNGAKEGTKEQERAFGNMLQFMSACYEAGVRIVVGSHTSAPFAEKGRAYQRELELLIDCGMTPLEAITAGTLVNARFFGVEDRLGTVEMGKLADLLIVEGDPSKQIDDLVRVQKVMLNGRWVELGVE